MTMGDGDAHEFSKKGNNKMRTIDAILRAEAIKDVLTDIGNGDYELKGCESAIVNEESNWWLYPQEGYYDLHWGKRCFRVDEEFLTEVFGRIQCENIA